MLKFVQIGKKVNLQLPNPDVLRPFLDILQKQKLEGDTSQKTRKYGVKSGFDAVSAFEAAKVGSNFCRPAKAEQTLGIVLSSC